MEGGDAEVTAALEAVDATLDALRSRDDTQGKFKAFSDFAEGLRARWEAASVERREVVTRIRDKEKLTLAPLADRVGISKTRLHQLINAGKKERETPAKEEE